MVVEGRMCSQPFFFFFWVLCSNNTLKPTAEVITAHVIRRREMSPAISNCIRILRHLSHFTREAKKEGANTGVVEQTFCVDSSTAEPAASQDWSASRTADTVLQCPLVDLRQHYTKPSRFLPSS